MLNVYELRLLSNNSKMLKVITETFLQKETKGDIEAAFSQKLESRRLGYVSGIMGHLFWRPGVKTEPFKIDFLVLEREYSTNPDFYFAVHRGIRIFLKPKTTQLSSAVFGPLKEIGNQFSVFLDGLKPLRVLFCKSCQISHESEERKVGTFKLDEELQLCSPGGNCSNLVSRHDVDVRLSMPFARSGGGDMSPEEEKAVLETIIKHKCFDPGKKE